MCIRGRESPGIQPGQRDRGLRAAGGGPGQGRGSRTSWGASRSPPRADATEGGRGPSQACVSWDKVLGYDHRGGSSETHTFVAASGVETNRKFDSRCEHWCLQPPRAPAGAGLGQDHGPRSRPPKPRPGDGERRVDACRLRFEFSKRFTASSVRSRGGDGSGRNPVWSEGPCGVAWPGPPAQRCGPRGGRLWTSGEDGFPRSETAANRDSRLLLWLGGGGRNPSRRTGVRSDGLRPASPGGPSRDHVRPPPCSLLFSWKTLSFRCGRPCGQPASRRRPASWDASGHQHERVCAGRHRAGGQSDAVACVVFG